ncbi:MAG: DUF2341 domain-containing protein, partial [Candidatus Margulisiibacteriota bacterium]
MIARDGVGNWGEWSVSWEVTYLEKAPPVVTVEAPSGGESWVGGTSHDLTFTATDEHGIKADSLGIWYSIDDGATYPYLITSEAPVVSPYNWTVPNINTTEVRVKVAVTDNTISQNVGSGESTSKMTIVFSAPTVNSINPNTGVNTQSFNDVAVGGGGIKSGATVKLTRSGAVDINATDVNFISENQLTCDLDLTGKEGGLYNVVITNPGEQAGTLTSGFTITNGPPTITLVDPITGMIDGGNQVTITGSGFYKEGIRRKINLNNPGPAETNYPVLAIVDTAALIAQGKMKADGGDIRFVASDEATPLSYWVESDLNTARTLIWVKVPTLLSGNSYVYLMYGDPALTSQSSLADTIPVLADAGNKVWLKANDGTGQTIDWAYIPTWTDMSGSGNTVTQPGTTSLQPRLRTNQLNQFPAVYFDGGDWLKRSSLTGITTQESALVVGKFTNLTNRALFDLSDQNNVTNKTIMLIAMDGLIKWRPHDELANQASFSFSDTTNYNLFYGEHKAAQRAIYMNGTLQNQNLNTSAYYNPLYLRVGALEYSSTLYPLSGYIAELIIFNKFLPTDERQRAEKYLNTKYQLYDTGSLPTAAIEATETGQLLTVNFGTTPAATVTWESSSSIKALAPTHPVGTVNVQVVNPDGQSVATLDAYTYYQPPLKLYSPDGGESWSIGSYRQITWEAITNPSSINLYYSVDNGTTYASIASGLPDTGSYEWFVAGSVTTEARVRIEAVSTEGTVTDESNAKFSMTAQRDYYVNVYTGNNSYNGLTPVYISGTTGPRKTLTYTAANTPIYSIINLAPGTYTAASGETFPISINNTKLVVSTYTRQATFDALANASDVFDLGASSTLEGLSIRSSNSSSSYYLVDIGGASAGVVRCNLVRTNQPQLIDASANYAYIYGNYMSETSTANYNVIYCNYTDLTFSSNTVEGSASGSLLRGSSNNAVIDGNRFVYNNSGSVINAGTSTGWTIQNNVVIGNGTGTGILATLSGYITTNEVRSFTTGINATANGALYIRKNTVVKSSTTGINGAISTGTVAIQDNVINNAVTLGAIGVTTGITGNSLSVSEDYNNFYGCAAAYSGTLTTGSNSNTLYPRFVAPLTNDYRLAGDSPVKNTASDGSYQGAYPTVEGSSSGILSDSYVSGSGSDETGDGSFANPWRSIRYALPQTDGVVHVLAGVYNNTTEAFPLLLGDNARVVGEGTGLATIEGEAITQDLFSVIGRSVSIEGLTFTFANNSAKYMINLASSGGGAVIRNNTLIRSVNTNTIYNDSSGNLIQGNWFRNTGTNTYCIRINTNGKHMTVAGNTFDASADQIISWVNYVTGATIEANRFNYTGSGSLVRDTYGSYHRFQRNVMIGNGSGIGIYMLRGYGSTISSSEIRSFGIGIHLEQCGSDPDYPVNVIKNTIIKNGTGVRIEGYYSTYKSRVYDNIISGAPGLRDAAANIGLQYFSGILDADYNAHFNNASSYSYGSHDLFDLYPKFVDVATDEYHLYDDSPCLGAASDGGVIGYYESIGSSSGILTESYISGSGSNETGDGTIGNPWRTITYSLPRTLSKINILPGRYAAPASPTGESFPITLNARTVLSGDGSGLATLEAGGMALSDAMVNIGRYCTVEGLSFTYSGPTWDWIIDYTGEYGTVRNSRFYRGANSYCFDFGGLSNGSFLGNTVTAPTSAGNVFYDSGNNLVISGNTVEANCGTSPLTSGFGDSNIVIDGNTIGYTGTNYAVYLASATNARVSRNLIIGRSAAGSGIRLTGASALVSTNEVRGFGVGIYAGSAGTTPTTDIDINRCTVVKNLVGIQTPDNDVYIYNTIISNAPTVESGTGGAVGSIGIYRSGTGGVTRPYYNDVYGCETLYSSVTSREGSISINAQFIDIDNSNYHLKPNSPCVGVGTPEGTDLGAYDGTAVYLLAPNGGEEWTIGGTSEILWRTKGYPTAIDLSYSIDDGATYASIAVDEADDGTYTWTIPAPATTEAKVRIEAEELGLIATRESAANFTISQLGATITQPVTAEILEAGRIYGISWEAVSLPTSFNLYYTTGDAYVLITSEVGGADRSYGWLVSDFPTTEARIKIEALKQTLIATMETDTFTIYTPPLSIEVATPNGGEIWEGESWHEITWEAAGLPDSYNLYYTTGDAYVLITSEVNGLLRSYNWRVANITTTEARVRVEAVKGGQVISDESDAAFTLQLYTPVVATVTFPNGGENLEAGSWRNLAWSATGLPSSFNLYYTTNEATGYRTITTEVSGLNRSYSWFVPNRPTTQAKVRVEAIKNSVLVSTDESDAGFTISRPTQYVVSVGIGSNESYDGLTSEVFVTDGVTHGPWQSITYTLANSQAGDRIWVMPGTYLQTYETFPITATDRWLTAQQTYTATIDSVLLAGDTVRVGNNGTVEGFTLKSKAYATNDYTYYATLNVIGNNTVVINNNITQESTVVWPSYPGNPVALTEDVVNCRLEGNRIAGQSTLVYFKNYGDQSRILVKNNYLSTTWTGILAFSSYYSNLLVTIEGNTIIADRGINGGVNSFNIYNNTIRSISGAGSEGIIMTQCLGTIEANLVSGYNTTGVKVTATSSYNGLTRIRHNTIVNNKQSLYISGSSVNSIEVFDNIVTAAPILGGFYADSSGITTQTQYALVHHNCVFNNETSYILAAGTQATFGEINASPRFVSTTASDYRLYGDSPCKGTASDGSNMGKYGDIVASSGLLADSYVDGVLGSDSNTGSLASPFKTISKATSLTEGGKVYLLSGSYAAGETFPLNFTYVSMQRLYATSEVSIDSSASANDTLILGVAGTTLEGITLYTSSSDNTCVRVAAPRVSILNNRITNSKTSGNRRALYFNENANNGLVSGNQIRANAGYYDYYGAVDFKYGLANQTVNNNIITAEAGIAIWVHQGDLTAEGNTVFAFDDGIKASGAAFVKISGNVVHKYGGWNDYASGISVGGPLLLISSNEVNGFIDSNSYGIVTNTSSIATIENNTVAKNLVGISAGTSNIYASNYLKNNIISAAPTLGGYVAGSIGIKVEGVATSEYNTLFNNATAYSGTANSQYQDNILNPRFVNPAANDFRLFADSPCIGTADNGGNRGCYGAVAQSSPITTESYVSNQGSDSTGTGTYADPWKTIFYALSTAEGTIYVLPGVYDNITSGETFPLSLTYAELRKYDPQSTVVINSNTSAGHTVIIQKDNISFEGFTVRGKSGTAYSACLYVNANGAVVRNNLISSESTAMAPLTAYGGENLFEGNQLYSTDNFIVRLAAANTIFRNNSFTSLDSGTGGYGFYATSGSLPNLTFEANRIIADNAIYFLGASCLNLDIRSNTIEAKTPASGGYGMVLGGSGNISSNEVRGFQAALSDRAAIVCDAVPPNYFTVNHNTLVKNYRGVYSTSGSNIIKNNIISAAPVLGTFIPGSEGIKVQEYEEGVDSSYNTFFNTATNYVGTVSNETADNEQNPKFVDPSGNDYRLLADSPCIAAADDGGNRGAFASVGTPSSVTSESYVGPFGSDTTGNGTFANPWRTMTKALSLTEGTVYALQGSYSGLETFPLNLGTATLRKYPSTALVTIDAGATAAHNLVLGNNISLEGFTVKKNNGSYACVYVNGANVTLLNNIISQESSGNAVFIDGSRSNIIGNNIYSYNSALYYSNNYYPLTYIRDNTLFSNWYSNGIAFYQASTGNIYGITIEGNTITADYGIYSYYPNYLRGVTIDRNKITATHPGTSTYAGMYFSGDGSIASNEVRGYQSSTYGGIYLYYSTGTNFLLDKNTIVQNNRGVRSNSADIIMTNNIIAGEVGGYSATGTYGLYSNSTNQITSRYNTFFANDTNYYNVTAGSGDNTVDPKFYDPNNRNYYLQPDSPCIDTGTPEGLGIDRGAYDYDFSVRVTAPNSGEVWQAGSARNITWQSSGFPTSINLYLSRDGGASYQQITTNEADDGTYSWLVDSTFTDQARVKVEGVSALSGLSTDESDGNFTITPATYYYVDSINGANNYNGLTTEVSGGNGPWQTLSYAGTQDVAGSTVVARGDFSADNGEVFPIIIVGRVFSGTGTTEIDTGLLETDGVSVEGNGTLEGFVVRSAATGNYAGVKVTGPNARLNNNQLLLSAASGNARALHIDAGGDNCRVYNNTISSEGHRTISVGSGANNVVFSDNVITNHSSGSDGIYLAGGDSITVEGNTITANYGIYQAGACTNFIARNNVIMGLDGGSKAGIYLNGDGNITLNEIRDYFDPLEGGINCVAGGTFTINKNTIAKSNVGIRSAVNANILNTIIAGSVGGYTTTETVKGIVQTGGTVNSNYNDLYAVNVTYEGTVGGGTGTIFDDPQFVDAAGNDYHLQAASNCIDAGDPDPQYNDPDTTRADMGAYYYDHPISLTIGAPLAGDVWQRGSWHNITWEVSPGTADRIDIYYSADSGATYSDLATGEADDNSFPWFVTEVATDTARIKIIATRSNVVTEESGIFAVTSEAAYYVNPVTGNNSYNGLTSEVGSGNNGPFKTLTYAATAAAASKPIYAASGTYNTSAGETFPVTISGRNVYASVTGQATIEEDGGAGTAVSLETAARLEGFFLKGNGGNALLTTSFEGVVVSRNIINAENYTYAILANAGYPTIEGNTIYRQTTAIYGYTNYGVRATDAYINRNTIARFRYGVYALAGTVKNNIMVNQPSLDAVAASDSVGLYGGAGLINGYNDTWNNGADYGGAFAYDATNKSECPGFYDYDAQDFRLYASTGTWTNPCLGLGEGGVNIGAYDGAGLPGSPYQYNSYVSGSGNDTTGDGSIGNPWRSISKALRYTITKINVLAGTYNQANGDTTPINLRERMHISGASRDTVTLEALAATAAFTMGSYTTVEGMHLLALGEGGSAVYGWSPFWGTVYISFGGTIVINGQYASVLNNRLTTQTQDTALSACDGYFNASGNILVNSARNLSYDKPAGRGIGIYNYFDDTINNWTIYKNEVREYGDGIYINGDNYGGTVDRNTLVMNHDGITSSSTQTVTV